MGHSFTSHDFFVKYFPPNVPIFWNTNVKNTNITPKFCHIVFIKFNVAKGLVFFNTGYPVGGAVMGVRNFFRQKYGGLKKM